DGWAYRNDATGPDGSTFVLGNWSFSGVDGLDGGDTNAELPVPFPNCTYSEVPPMVIQANDDSASGEINQTLNINVLANDDLPNGFESVEIHEDPANGTATVVLANGSIDYDPDLDFCGNDSFSYIVCDASDCDTATVSVNIICPISYPQYTIGEVTTVNANGVADSLGVTCEITGIVYGINQRPPNGLQFTIIDENNEDDGIGLFSGAENWGYTVDEGDEVVIRGTIEQFNGLTQINPDTVWEVSSGNSLHNPEVVTDMSEDTESKLVRFENMSFIEDLDTVWTGTGPGYNVKISDGTNTFIMRIDNDVDLFDMP